MKIIIRSTAIFTILVATWCSCGKETVVSPPSPGNEALTTMILRATNNNDGTDTPMAKWVELDPSGATPPDTSMAKLYLKHGASYSVTIQLLDSMVDVTSEIKVRQNYHLFCFGVQTGLNLTCTQTDKDTNPTPLPIGLTDLFTAGAASSGNLEITLHHQPNVNNGDCAPGSIDMDCNFKINIVN